MQIERRKFQRVTLPDPIRANVGQTVVYVLDASTGGIQIAHKTELPVGAFCRLDSVWKECANGHARYKM